MQEDSMSQLISTFKNMLNNNNNINSSSDNESNSNSSSAANTSTNNASLNRTDANNNFNISPEMISNMANMLKKSNLPNNSNAGSNSNTNFGVNLDSLNTSNNTNSNSNTGTGNTNTSIDFETIMKLKSVMDTLNKKDDPRSNLLYSLKPYLRKTRQEKLDQYVNLLKITQVTDLFNFKKGDKK